MRTSYEGSVFYQPTGAQQAGHEILDPPSWICHQIEDCRNSDSALIRADFPIDLGRIARTTSASPEGCEHCVEDLTIDPGEPTFVISGRIDHVFENEPLNKIGRTSGWTRGDVESTCDDFKSGLEGSNDKWIKLCSDRVDFNIDAGDSGSPVFSMNGDGTVVLRGIAFSEGWGLGYYDGIMSDLHQIEKDLGPLTVFDPGPPIVSIMGPTEVPPDVYCSWEAHVVNGIPPFSYQWSGMFSGTTRVIDGFVSSGGYLYLELTDGIGRESDHLIEVVVEGDPGPFTC